MSQWEKVLHSGDEYTDRMRVDGGWIYKHQVHDGLRNVRMENGIAIAIGMVFVPDQSQIKIPASELIDHLGLDQPCSD